MPVLLPLPLRNLPRPVSMDLGLDLMILDSDGPHTSAPSDLAKLMRMMGNPVYTSDGGFIGRVTQTIIENWIKNNPTLPPPMRPEDTNRAIMAQCSFADTWGPTNQWNDAQYKADEQRTDHPILNFCPLGKNGNVPWATVSPYAQLCIKFNSGSPWAYMYLFTLALAAMDRSLRLQWKASGAFWANTRDKLVAPCLKAEGIVPDNMRWWPPLRDKLMYVRLQSAVALAANQYSE